jgi:hypothetical protein
MPNEAIEITSLTGLDHLAVVHLFGELPCTNGAISDVGVEDLPRAGGVGLQRRRRGLRDDAAQFPNDRNRCSC